MSIQKEGVSKLDNDNNYIEFIESAIKLADPTASTIFQRSNEKLNVTIFPSNPEFKQHLIETILEAHRRLKLKIHYSSSLRISKTIYYYLEI